MTDNDEYYMHQALYEAEKALRYNEVPVGAILVKENKILHRAYNQTLNKNDPTAHAEVLAIREACHIVNNHRLTDCDLYVTLEPCAMCLGAIIQARIKRLIFGAYDPKAGAVKSIMRFPFEKTNHCIKIKGGILEAECGKILKDFFKAKR